MDPEREASGCPGSSERVHQVLPTKVLELPCLVFYSAFDAVVGLSNGLIVKYGSQLPPAEQAVLPGASDAHADLVNQPVPLTIYLIGTLSWAVAVIAAAIALNQAGARRIATIPLGLAGVIGAVDHAAPFGPVAMLLFIIAAFVLRTAPELTTQRQQLDRWLAAPPTRRWRWSLSSTIQPPCQKAQVLSATAV
jgi:hypothetical protein